MGSGLRPGVQSPLQSAGGGGGRGQSLRALAKFCLPRRVPSRVPRRVPCLTGTLEGTLCGTREGTLRGTRVHVDAFAKPAISPRRKAPTGERSVLLPPEAVKPSDHFIEIEFWRVSS